MTLDPTSVAVVVAVGPLDRAKSRLEPALDATERRQLVLAMLDDVLTAVRGAHDGPLVVVTPDDDVTPLVAPHRATILRDAGNGTNAAIVTALADPIVESSHAVLVLQGDLPQLTSAHVEQLRSNLLELRAPGALLVPNDDGGTSALALSPPNAMPTAFGPESGARHRQSAADSNIALHELPIPALSSDVDTIEDLERVGRIAGPATSALLAQLGVVTP